MHSKSCYALFLLVLVACQAAPSHKIIEKSINETGAKFAKKDLKLEDTGADKDRTKKSTTFCVQVHSGKEEIVPCNQEVKETPVIKVESHDYKPQTAPVPMVQYPVSNIVVQQPVPQPPQVIPQSTFVHVPVQPQQSASITAPQPQQQVPQQQVHIQPQHPSVIEPVSQVHVQQPAVPAPAPTPIINIIPAPTAPCEKPKIEVQPPQQIHTVHVVQPSQPAPPPAPQSPVIHHVVQPPQPVPQLPVIHEVKPIKIEQERPPQFLPLSQQEINVPVAHFPCKSDVILAPPSPVELIYQEEPSKLVEYLPVPQEYECSCRSEQQSRIKSPKHHVTLYPGNGRMSLRSPMMAVQYNPNVMGREDTSPVVFAAQTREAEGRHHHTKKFPVHLSVQYPAYSSYNNPPKYESYSYIPSTSTNNNNNYPFSSPYGTYSSYPAVSYDSYSKEYSYPYSTITINTGGPFYKNSEDENSQEFSADNKSTQEILSSVQDLSFNNQKRETISTQLRNDKQKETTEGLPMEKESIKQVGPKTDEILKQKKE